MDKEFTTKISGIPCKCKVLHYRPAVPDRVTGRWEDAELGSGSEFDFEIYDRKGYRAHWLERKLTPADRERLEEEWEVTLLEYKHYID